MKTQLFRDPEGLLSRVLIGLIELVIILFTVELASLCIWRRFLDRSQNRVSAVTNMLLALALTSTLVMNADLNFARFRKPTTLVIYKTIFHCHCYTNHS